MVSFINRQDKSSDTERERREGKKETREDRDGVLVCDREASGDEILLCFTLCIDYYDKRIVDV